MRIVNAWICQIKNGSINPVFGELLVNDGKIEEIIPVDSKDPSKEKIGKDDKLVIIHPGSGGSSIDLPIERMIELTKKLSELKDIKIFITGDNSEKELCNKLIVKESIVNLAGKLNLSELISLLNRADIFISVIHHDRFID